MQKIARDNGQYYNIINRDGNQSNFWTGFGFLQEFVQKRRIPDSYFWRIRIPNILKVFFLNKKILVLHMF